MLGLCGAYHRIESGSTSVTMTSFTCWMPRWITSKMDLEDWMCKHVFFKRQQTCETPTKPQVFIPSNLPGSVVGSCGKGGAFRSGRRFPTDLVEKWGSTARHRLPISAETSGFQRCRWEASKNTNLWCLDETIISWGLLRSNVRSEP